VFGALIAGIGADATSPRTAILIVALLTAPSGLFVGAISCRPDSHSDVPPLLDE